MIEGDANGAAYANYVPEQLSEIYDKLGAMMLGAPTFVDRLRIFPDQDINSEFRSLVASFDEVREKVGDARYAELVDLAHRAHALFAADQEDTNGKADQGRQLLYGIEAIIEDVQRERIAANLPDVEGQVTGD